MDYSFGLTLGLSHVAPAFQMGAQSGELQITKPYRSIKTGNAWPWHFALGSAHDLGVASTRARREKTDVAKRSWLYVPGNRLDRVAKAFATDCDAVIVDLEDACPAAEKASARIALAQQTAEWPAGRGYVRINACDTDLALADLDGLVRPGVAGIILPKSETAEQLRAVDWVIGQLEKQRSVTPGGVRLIPLIETAAGIIAVNSIAREAPARVRQLMFGAGDLTADLGIAWTAAESELADARSKLVLASRGGRLERPIDTPWPHVADVDGLARSIETARTMGFGGKAAIHPGQLGLIATGFQPTEEECASARRVLAAYAASERSGSGAFLLDGRLVDYVSVVNARRILNIVDADDGAT